MSGRTKLASVEIDLGQAPIDPVALLALADAEEARFFWSSPGDEGISLAAFGSVAEESWARQEFAALGVDIARFLHDAAPDVPTTWLGGFAFDGDAMVSSIEGNARLDMASGRPAWGDFPAMAFRLPRWSLIRHGGTQVLRGFGWEGRASLQDAASHMAERLHSGSESRIVAAPPSIARPDRIGGMIAAASDDAWTKAVVGLRGSEGEEGLDLASIRAPVARAVEAIRRGEAEKVVLAVSRERAYADPAQPNPLDVLSRFRREQPGCFHFMISPKPGSAWVGASPERLVRVMDGKVSTMALAGSAARGATPEEDRALGDTLLASAKDRREHALVVEDIVDRLRDVANDIRMPAGPSLRRLATIQHLETLIEIDGMASANVLALVERLHPTPALGGSPREAALRLIREIEPAVPGRGWYAGGVGWIDGRGQGELAVAIRSLLLRPGKAIAFAGAGLVAESDPDAEAREIALKLQVARAALG